MNSSSVKNNQSDVMERVHLHYLLCLAPSRVIVDTVLNNTIVFDCVQSCNIAL
jgi:hypothetical protein